MNKTLNRLAIFIFGLAFSASILANVEVPETADLAELGKQADQAEIPILVMVSQDHCPFCEKLKEEILRPMLISGDYTDKAIITELVIDSYKNILDFDGGAVHPSTVADRFGVWVTPTILFLDAQGKEVHPRMLGVNTIEMYGYYLDESIDGALKAIRSPAAKPYVPTQEDLGIAAPPSPEL